MCVARSGDTRHNEGSQRIDIQIKMRSSWGTITVESIHVVRSGTMVLDVGVPKSLPPGCNNTRNLPSICIEQAQIQHRLFPIKARVSNRVTIHLIATMLARRRLRWPGIDIFGGACAHSYLDVSSWI